MSPKPVGSQSKRVLLLWFWRKQANLFLILLFLRLLGQWLRTPPSNKVTNSRGKAAITVVKSMLPDGCTENSKNFPQFKELKISGFSLLVPTNRSGLYLCLQHWEFQDLESVFKQTIGTGIVILRRQTTCCAFKASWLLIWSERKRCHMRQLLLLKFR